MRRLFNDDSVKVEYGTYSIKEELATFHVTGKYKGERLNETVAVSRNHLSRSLGQKLSEYEYLKEISYMKDHANKDKDYREILSELAIAKHTNKKEELDKFMMMLDLSDPVDPQSKKSSVTTLYDRTGTLYTI